MARKAPAQRAVVDLEEERARRRLELSLAKLRLVMESNERAFGRLFDSGVLFTSVGTRTGRDLLLTHQHLLRMRALLDKLTPKARRLHTEDEVEQVYSELESLLDKTHALTHRTGRNVAKLGRE